MIPVFLLVRPKTQKKKKTKQETFSSGSSNSRDPQSIVESPIGIAGKPIQSNPELTDKVRLGTIDGLQKKETEGASGLGRNFIPSLPTQTSSQSSERNGLGRKTETSPSNKSGSKERKEAKRYDHRNNHILYLA